MWLFFWWCAVSSWAYNIDVENAQIYTNPKKRIDNERKSYFGFSVALYVNPNAWNLSLVLVGAPRANVSQLPMTIEPGSVFKCPVQSNESCKEWILDSNDDGNSKFRGSMSTSRNTAWTGANIAIKNGTNPTVLVCAPRWKAKLKEKDKISEYRLYLNGACYRSKVNDSFTFERSLNKNNQSISTSIISPFLSNAWQEIIVDGKAQNYFGMAQAGFSIHMVPNKEDFILGSPGFSIWTGIAFLVSVEEKIIKRNDKNIRIFSDKHYSYEALDAVINESSVNYNEYLGYSVSSGCYFQEGELWFSSGIPRGDNLNGKVIIFLYPNRTIDPKFTINKNVLYGEQHGEYFGSVLASCDLNNDGKDELIVGAPLWTNEFEEGRVYVYSSKGLHPDASFGAQYIHGEIIKGRFGLAISCIGDIDYDKYGDLAIGAPYENDHGAIYIYRGSENGLQRSQKIFGSEISPAIRGFGISFSEARDVDGNGYSDIAVGAYLSDNAVLLRSKPVVTLKVTKISSLPKKLQINSTFFMIEACFYYSGMHVPEKINVTLNWKIDERLGRARLSQEENNATMYGLLRTLRKDFDFCDNYKIYLNSKIQSFIDPMEISVSLNLETVQLNSTVNSKNRKISESQFCKTCPVINKENSTLENSMTLFFAVDCGPDDICNSNLILKISSDLRNNYFTLPSQDTFTVFVNISNQGEPAYQSKVQIYFPEVLVLASIPPECHENMETIEFKEMIEMTCNVGNPLREHKSIKLELSTNGFKCDSNSTELEFRITTESENNNKNNSYKMPVHFDVDLDLLLSGKTQEESYSFLNEKIKNMEFEHIYEIKKFGSCALEEILVSFKIPSFLKEEGKDSIKIAKIVKLMGLIDNYEVQCIYSNDKSFALLEEDNYLLNVNKIEKPIKKNFFKTVSTGENSMNYVPPENRTLYINCSNPIISCITLNCMLTGLSNSTVWKVFLLMELQTTIFKFSETEGKDIIFFVSEGEIVKAKSGGLSNVTETKASFTLVGSTFLGMPVDKKVALWILILSTLLGILLLTFLIFVLRKLGFFARTRRQKLRALKSDSNKKRIRKTEATSSGKALNVDQL